MTYGPEEFDEVVEKDGGRTEEKMKKKKKKRVVNHFTDHTVVILCFYDKILLYASDYMKWIGTF